MKKRENIVLYVADQLRSDALHHLGNPAARTPNLDALAGEGVSFRNTYCQNPVCVPSRCSFLTGLYPHTTGHRTMHYLQEPGEPNILRVMKEQGYEVIWVGRNDVIPADRPKTDYCDEYYDGLNPENRRDLPSDMVMRGYHDMKIERPDFMERNPYSFYIGKQDGESAARSFDVGCLQSALDYLERRRSAGSEKPFFLYITVMYPHPPYVCADPWYSSVDRAALPPRRPDVEKLPGKPLMLRGIRAKQDMGGWTEEMYGELRATYLGMTAQFDDHVGRLCGKLKECGLYEGTNVLVTSDHGDYTGDYGIAEKVQNCFEDCVSNVPLILKPAAGRAVAPRISDALVELLDLPATLADIGGFELPYTQFGRSILHTLGGEETHRDAVFCEGGRLAGEEQAKESGHGPDSPYWPRLSTQCEGDEAHGKAAMVRMGSLKYTQRLYGGDELYDLERDPQETRNLIGDPAYAPELERLRARLLRWYMETADFVPSRRDKR